MKLAVSDRGSASLEFLVLGVVLPAMIMTGGLAILQVQRWQLACILVSRQTARAITLGDDLSATEESVLQVVSSNYGIDPSNIAIAKSVQASSDSTFPLNFGALSQGEAVSSASTALASSASQSSKSLVVVIASIGPVSATARMRMP